MTSKVYPHLATAADPDANLFISPVSLSQGLGLAYLGARGGTRDEIGRVLGWSPDSNANLHVSAYNASLGDTGDTDTTLKIANALWLTKAVPIRSEYVTEAGATFGAAPEMVDFAGNPQGTAARINSWVSERTKGRITQIVPASGLDPDTAAVLSNALYFKAKWQVPFQHTERRAFTRGDGVGVPITMMKRVDRFAYRENAEGQAIALPYGTESRFVMEVFLPRDAAVMRRWEREMNGADFFAGEQGGNDRFDLSAAPEREIRIVLPRFEARFGESVKAALIAAGMPSAFDRQRADLSGMGNGVRLAINDVAHATFLRVDQLGTEAAAATAVAPGVVSAAIERDVPEMVVDRPFLVTLRDRKSGAVLFFGRVANPAVI